MNKLILALALVCTAANTASADSHLDKMAPAATVQVGGEAMFPMKDIVENAVHSADHTTLVAAVQAADLVETLKGKGPFTVFAPTNDAFENLPAGAVEALLRPENKMKLTQILTYHVVAGRMDVVALRKAIQQGGGKAALRTVSGGTLWVKSNGPANIVLEDEQGGIASISTYDVIQSNGVIHVINRVVQPS